MIVHTLVTPPSSVVSMQQVRAHLRLTHTSQDEYLDHLRNVATEEVQQLLGGDWRLGVQTWRTTFDPIMPSDWVVPLRPLQSQSPIAYDVNGYEYVEYVVGFPVVPSPLIHAILMMVSHLFSMAMPVASRQHYEVPMTVSSLVGKYASQYV